MLTYSRPGPVLVSVLVLVTLPALLLAGGCAKIDHTSVPSAEADHAADGFRYYEPAVYLLAWSDGNGNVKTQLKVMPDQTRKMTARPAAFWAKLKAELTFDRGMLTSTTTKGEAAAVPKAIADIVKEAAGTIAGIAALAGDKAARDGVVPAPIVFKIVPDARVAGRYVFYSSEPVDPFSITLPEPKKPS